MKKWLDKLAVIFVAILVCIPFALVDTEKPTNIMELLENYALLWVIWVLTLAGTIILSVYLNILLDKFPDKV